MGSGRDQRVACLQILTYQQIAQLITGWPVFLCLLSLSSAAASQMGMPLEDPDAFDGHVGSASLPAQARQPATDRPSELNP